MWQLLLACLSCSAAPAPAHPEPPCNEYEYGVTLPENGTCEQWLASGELVSACWRPPSSENVTSLGHYNSTGALNLDLWEGVSMPDYPPVFTDPVRSTYPLLSPSVMQYSARAAGQDRATLDSVIDLVTGTPLLKETDFVLPFGTAQYRHIRTMSDGRGIGTFELANGVGHPSRNYWDWCGQGWMMGVAPMLLIDSSYYGWSSNPGGRRCYLMLDAHHAIPFDKTSEADENWRYVAPGARAARLVATDYDESVMVGGVSQQVPKKFTVYLDSAGLRYELTAHYDDVYFDSNRDLHARSATSADTDLNHNSFGIPYYATCDLIADQHGNCIKIEYLDTDTYTDEQHTTSACHRCCQQCRRKGAVSRVLLQSDNGAKTHWTLLFTYREFRNYGPGILDNGQGGTAVNDCENNQHRQLAVHSVHVFRNGPNADEAEFDRDQTRVILPYSVYEQAGCVGENPCLQPNFAGVCKGMQRMMGIDIVDDANGYLAPANITPWTAEQQSLRDWEYEVKYLYSDASDVFRNEGWKSVVGGEGLSPDVWGQTRLLACTVNHRPLADAGPAVVTSSNTTIYRYCDLEYDPNQLNYTDTHHVGAVFDQQAIGRVREAIELKGFAFRGNETPHWVDSSGEASDGTIKECWPLSLLYLDGGSDLSNSTANAPQPLSDWASQRFKFWDQVEGSETGDGYGTYAGFASGSTNGISEYRDQMQSMSIQAQDAGRLALLPFRVHMYSTHTGGQKRYYKLYGFMKPPSGNVNQGNLEDSEIPILEWPLRALFHEPFAYIVGTTALPTDMNDTNAYVPYKDPLWFTVIDEYPSEEACRFEYGGMNGRTSIALSSEERSRQALSRRVVKMNRAGFVLSDRTYTPDETGSFEPSESIGFEERFVYEEDPPHRLVKHHTLGCSVAVASGTDDAQGLIELFEYPAYAANSEVPAITTPTCVKIQKGTDGAAQLLKQNIFSPDRPDLIRCEILYTTPTTNAASENFDPLSSTLSNIEWTLHDYSLGTPAHEGELKPILSHKVIRPATAQVPGASASKYYSVDWRVYDKGFETWHIYGSVKDLASPGSDAGDRIALDCNFKDEQGRLIGKALDIDGSFSRDADSEFEAVAPSISPPWSRAMPQPPFEYTTRFQVDSYGVKMTRFPNGRCELRKLAFIASSTSQSQEIVTYHDLEPVIINTSLVYDVLGQVDYQLIVDGEPKIAQNGIRSGTVESGYNFNQGQQDGHSGEMSELTSSFTFEMDASGNPKRIEARNAGSTVPDLAVEMSFGRIGELEYQKDPAGNLTRTLHTPRGQVERVFKGTNDEDPFWGAGSHNESENMYLSEGRIYGTGVNDALQLTQIRRYRSKLPNNQQYGSLTAWRSAGIAEIHRYDWRSRDVVVERWPEGAATSGAPETSTYTYLDHAGRVRFVATFAGAGPKGNTALDPASFPDTFEFPSNFAHALLSQSTDSLRPLRLSESIYNARGEVEEQRNYNVGITDGTSYLATLTFYDHAGRPVWTRSPNGGVQKTTYDALGRAISTSTWAGPSNAFVEVSRTETGYDPDGNAVETTSWERLHDAAATTVALEVGTGTANNAIRTRTFNWYDLKRRVIATAELGTTDDQNHFVPIPSLLSRLNPSDQEDGLTNEFQASPCVFANGMLVGSTTAMFPSSFSSRVRISCFQYDEAGHKIREVLPNRSVTSYTYDGLGQLASTLENADAPLPADRRLTVNKYEHGKLVGIANVAPDFDFEVNSVPWNAVSATSAQVTMIEYAAQVVDDGLNVISTSYEQPGFVVFPYGAASTTLLGLRFQYYPDGLLASRTDERGVKFAYKYDSLSRLSEINVNYGDMAASPPPDRVTKVEILYNSIDQPTDVKSYAGSTLVAHTPMVYDPRGNLSKQRQSLGQLATTSSPTIEYTWDHAGYNPSQPGTANHDRLKEMLYPLKAPTGTQKRKLTYACGATDSLDDVLCRILEVKQALGSTVKSLSTYAYSGSSRVVRTTQGDSSAIVQSVGAAGTAGYPGLDMFGRVSDFHFKKSSTDATLFRSVSAFDASGNRAYSRITRSVGTQEDNQASALFGYNALDQLTKCEFGTLVTEENNQPVTPRIDPSTLFPATRTAYWHLDQLGNLVGKSAQGANPAIPGYSVSDRAPTETIESFYELTHDVSVDNRLTEVTEMYASGGGTPAPTSAPILYDSAGNLVLDQLFFYEYDSWNRPVRISTRGTITNVNGMGQPTSGTPGGWLVRFAYDGLGRLIKATRPDTPDLSGHQRETISEYFYDGIRRVQERTWGYTIVEGEGGSGEGGTGLSGQGSGSSLPPPSASRATREYLHGPGYVHHLLAQVSPQNQLMLVIQDQAEDVVTLTDANGNAIEQRTYDPYGQVVRQTVVGGSGSPHDPCAVGHHGVFSYRLDLDSILPAEMEGFTAPPAITTLSEGVYYNVNRIYSPRHQRFLQQDMNATGMVVVGGEMGSATAFRAPAFVGGDLVGDGLSLFGYVRSNSISRSDPLGLYMDDGEYDEEDLFEDVSDVMGILDVIPGPSDFIRGALEALVGDYAENLSFDLDWASDWSLPDDDHSRNDNTWIALAVGRGLHDAFDISLPGSDNSYNILDGFAARKSSGGGGGNSPGAGSGGKKKKGGWNAHTARGVHEHNKYKAELRAKGYKTEFDIPGYGRADAVNWKTFQIREFKPFTPAQIARGAKQLRRYIEGLEAHWPETKGKWTGHLDFYVK